MKVYVATRGEYDEFRVIGVFSCIEAYRRFINEGALKEITSANPEAIGMSAWNTHLNCPPRPHDLNDPIEMEVDALAPIEWKLVTREEVYPDATFSDDEDYPKHFVKACGIPAEDDE